MTTSRPKLIELTVFMVSYHDMVHRLVRTKAFFEKTAALQYADEVFSEGYMPTLRTAFFKNGEEVSMFTQEFFSNEHYNVSEKFKTN